MGLVKLENVYHFYDLPEQKRVIPVLKGINLDVAEGEIIAILGPSGSGKSTLLKVILGEESPIVGEVHLHSEISYLPQDPNEVLFDDISVERWFELIAQNSKLSPASFDTLLGKIMEDWEFLPFLHNTLSNLSGGQKQRVALASTFLRGDKILLLDEPTSMLNTHLSHSIITTLREYAEIFSPCIIFVTHSFSFSEGADKYYELFDGSLRQTGKFNSASYIGNSPDGHYTVALDKWGRMMLPPSVMSKIRSTDTVTLHIDGDQICIKEEEE